jgi:hypothetical protein
MRMQELPFDRIQARLLPLADLLMIVMFSRPESGTLRTTRVTIVTILLAAIAALLAALLALALAVRAPVHDLGWLLAVIGLGAFAALCADLAVYGARQRILIRRSGR